MAIIQCPPLLLLVLLILHRGCVIRIPFSLYGVKYCCARRVIAHTLLEIETISPTSHQHLTPPPSPPPPAHCIVHLYYVRTFQLLAPIHSFIHVFYISPNTHTDTTPWSQPLNRSLSCYCCRLIFPIVLRRWLWRMLVITAAVVVVLDSPLHGPMCFAVLLCVVRMGTPIVAAAMDRPEIMEMIRGGCVHVSCGQQ